MRLIEQIKQTYNLAAYLAPRTQGLKPSGRDFYLGVCPFCTDRQNGQKPKRKLWVNTRSNTCGCFKPSCRAFCNQAIDHNAKPLDIINVYAMLEGVSLPEAVYHLAKKAGLI